MTIWLACADGFIQADVIRWQEGIWGAGAAPKGARSMKIGDREVIAEVIDGPDGAGLRHVAGQGMQGIHRTSAQCPHQAGDAGPAQGSNDRAWRTGANALERRSRTWGGAGEPLFANEYARCAQSEPGRGLIHAVGRLLKGLVFEGGGGGKNRSNRVLRAPHGQTEGI